MTAVLQINQKRLYEQAKRVRAQGDVLAVIKNNAYNVGLELAVRTFYEAGIRAFATTSLLEAVEVRRLLPDSYVFLMNPSREFDVLRENRIAMTLPSLSFYETHKADLAGIEVHLEYKNLLRRSGFENAEEMIQVLTENQVNITGIWTHFAFADELDRPEYEQEKQGWLDTLQKVQETKTDFRFIHAQNSASFMRDGFFPGQTHARLGILLYGSRPYSSLDPEVAPAVVTVSANVIQTVRLKKGESSGYSSAFIATADCTVAIADIGYGDGVLRTRSKHDALINGKRYPIGALMMSHMLIEADDSVEPGDTVYLYNDELRVDHYTFLGVGANSEQMSALNHNTLVKEILT